MTLSHDKNLLASCSLDNIIKIIEVDFLAERPKDGRTFDMQAYEESIKSKLKPNHGKLEINEDEEMEENKNWKKLD